MFSKKQTLLITVLALFVLATMAIAYGAWTDSLEIHGTASTGTLNVHFTEVTATDNETAGMEEVGTCSANIVDQSSDPEANDSDRVEVLIENAYPGYTCTLTGTIANNGTIPVKLSSVVFDPTDLASKAALDFEAPGFTAPNVDVIEDGASVTGEITLTPTATAAEGASYSGTITLTFVQVNP